MDYISYISSTTESDSLDTHLFGLGCVQLYGHEVHSCRVPLDNVSRKVFVGYWIIRSVCRRDITDGSNVRVCAASRHGWDQEIMTRDLRE